MNASYATIHIQNAAELNAFAVASGTASGTIAEDIVGWNVQAGIHVLQLLGRGTTHDVVLHGMYEFIDTQSDIPVGFALDPKGERNVITVGLAYYPISKVALKADFQSFQFDNKTSAEQFNFGMAYMF